MPPKSLSSHEKTNELIRLEKEIERGLDLPEAIIERIRISLTKKEDEKVRPMSLCVSRFDNDITNIMYIYLDTNPNWILVHNFNKILNINITRIVAVY